MIEVFPKSFACYSPKRTSSVCLYSGSACQGLPKRGRQWLCLNWEIFTGWICSLISSYFRQNHTSVLQWLSTDSWFRWVGHCSAELVEASLKVEDNCQCPPWKEDSVSLHKSWSEYVAHFGLILSNVDKLEFLGLIWFFFCSGFISPLASPWMVGGRTQA